ncbi:virulence factor [Macrococcoides caseolyticum]|uniref:virulence factor n=1 Tax=Macrococcoides caseolyticum TaxID=69966 RepID=UPI001F1651CB|nr:virulence factor [Macrococcus caseolyticus]MCE4957028.1 virulence factor [Macrococcus caseolyticus]
MKIIKIEPTPSPNTLKVTLDYKKDDMKSTTYQTINDQQPSFINALLEIEEVKSIFHVMDFISIDKSPKSDWEMVLPKIKAVFDQAALIEPTIEVDNGEKNVEVLTFKGIPYQIKVTSKDEEKRKQLDVRFIDAMLAAQNDEDNVILLRKWKDYGIRYGETDDIIQSIKEEIDALFPQSELDDLVKQGKSNTVAYESKKLEKVRLEEYQNTSDWQERYRMIDHYPQPDISDIAFFEAVLNDERPQIRRLAVVFLGMIEDKRVLKALHQAMLDSNLTVRRTAGDTLSDLGFKESLGVMHQALDDKHPIVRWRAAMFIYDEGDESSLPFLEKHLNDQAFDVKLQVQMAYERIKNGETAVGSVWKQIANRNKGEA